MELTNEEITAFQRLYSETTGIALDNEDAREVLMKLLLYLRWLHQFD